MRPDGAVVVRHRVEAQFALGHRAHSPTGEELFIAKTGDELPPALRMRYPRVQAVTGIRSAHATGLLVAVECQREGLDVRTPEGGIESRLQRLRGLHQRDGV